MYIRPSMEIVVREHSLLRILYDQTILNDLWDIYREITLRGIVFEIFLL